MTTILWKFDWLLDLLEVVDRRGKSVVEDLSEEQSDLHLPGTAHSSLYKKAHLWFWFILWLQCEYHSLYPCFTLSSRTTPEISPTFLWKFCIISPNGFLLNYLETLALLAHIFTILVLVMYLSLILCFLFCLASNKKGSQAKRLKVQRERYLHCFSYM